MGWAEEREHQAQQTRKRIAKAVAEEREACAIAAESKMILHRECSHGGGYMDGREDAALAIRARTKTRLQ
jgi:uncharacterized protein YqfA (UPF0365 family)